MATDPDRPSDGRPPRARAPRLSLALPHHAALQAAWALGMLAPAVPVVERLLDHPNLDGLVSVVEVSGVWALIAGLAWGARVAGLTTGGAWGRATRRRIAQHARTEVSRGGSA